VILPHGERIPYVVGAPKFSAERARETPPLTGNFTWRDDFDSHSLRPEWLQVRVPKETWWDVVSRPGWLTIHPLPVPLDALSNPSFLARRQQHQSFDASTELEVPSAPGVAVGLAAFQSENAWYFLGVQRRDSDRAIEVFLWRRSGKRTETVARAALNASTRLRLRISANVRSYSFYFEESNGGWKPLKEADDGSILSTDVAGGFVGTTVGPYAYRCTVCAPTAN
jgi:alpha-N-arabinofuranosidase